MSQTIRIGTRGSELALWQARHVADLLREKYPEATVELNVYTTKGDTILDKSLPEIGGKGLFTEELERVLLAGEIDCAVHSLKDLPTENPKGLIIGAVPKRAAVNDVLISKHSLPLDKLPEGAKIGTSSLRRAAQLLHYRPDFEIIDLRGNVPTRINKALAKDSHFDAIVLAQAGVERLRLMHSVTQIIPLDIMLPAPAQGALGIQCRDLHEDKKRFGALTDRDTFRTVEAERSFLNALEGGCSVPVAAYCFLEAGEISPILRGRVLSPDGSKMIDISEQSYETSKKAVHDGMHARVLGRVLAEKALKQGAGEFLAEVKK